MPAVRITADRCLRAAYCALAALVGLGCAASYGQFSPAGPALGPSGQAMPASGSAASGPGLTPVGPVPTSAAPPGLTPVVPQEEQVLEVRIEGNRTISLEKILRKIRTRAGRPYVDDQVQQDVRELSKMGVFAYVRPLIQKVPGGVVIIFQLAERPLLKEVIFVGNDTFLTSALRKEAELKAGDAADPFAVANARHKIETYYQGKGFSKVRVTVLEGDKAGDLRAVFVVDEGPRQRVFWVNFVGNNFISSARLKTIIQTHPPYLYLFTGEVDRKQIEEDVAKLTAYYRDYGFYFARVGRILEFNDKQNWLTITFVIDEGPRYSVRNIVFLGNKKFDNSRLAAKLKLLSGQYFDKNQQNLDLMKLRDEYGGDGYVFARIEADNRLLDEPGKLDIVYNVTEGARYRFGRINIEIKGENPHTQITTVLNRLSFKPGDIVDTREIVASERRLKSAQLFKVEPQKGVEPKIAYSPPESEDKDTMMAGQRRATYYRVPGGEAPLPPDEAYLDLFVSAETQKPEGAGFLAPPHVCPQPTFIAQTFQPSQYDSRIAPGQAYPAPSYFPQAPQATQSTQTFVRVQQVRYEPGDAASQSWQNQGQNWPATTAGPSAQGYGAVAPQQGQNWAAGGNANSGGYVTQPPQGYYAQQTSPATGPMVYNPPPTAYGNPPANGYGGASSYGAPVASPGYGPSPSPANTYGYPAAAPASGPAFYTPSGPATSRPVPQVAAAGDLFSNPDPTMIPPPTGEPLRDLPTRITPEETQTGRLMFGVGVNSDAGLVGNVTIDEQNFDWRQFPTSWDDITEGRAFRGAGERFRLELVPGTQVQRYMISFSEPYLNNQPVALSLSGFYYQRIYQEWSESRIGGSVGFGYQFTHDLTGSIRFQAQNVDIKNPEFPVPELEETVGHNQLYTTTLSLQHDTRDSPFLATEGHLMSASVEETVGTYQYPRMSMEFSQFFRIFERADRSGKHVLSFKVVAGYSGDQTPIFEKYYDGGFSSIRGFAFRGVTPRDPVYHMGIGGDFSMTSTVQYLFPITADDMLKGVVFVDAGTVEPRISDWVDRVRVAPGFGLRISIPMMGPAPIALDFAFPVSQQNGDSTQLFSFFVGFNH